MFIKNFAHQVHHLVKLTHKEATFKYGPEQIQAQEDLKQALLNSPALRPIDYNTNASVILSVDTSYIAVGYILGQCDTANNKIRQDTTLLSDHTQRTRGTFFTTEARVIWPLSFLTSLTTVSYQPSNTNH